MEERPDIHKGHRVLVGFGPGGKFFYEKDYVIVCPGDVIEWKIERDHPFGIFVKADPSPLERSVYTAKRGGIIRARVREDARRGVYPYAVGVSDGEDIYVDDPDIIVRDPKRP